VVDTKPDLTPVSEADRAVEEALRRRLAEVRPDHGVLGEEFGVVGEGARCRWIVDPIDGTRNFVRGIPIWATLIAVERDGVLEVGVASAPALGRRWWAARGEGAFADGSPIGVSAVGRIEDAVVSFGADPGGMLPLLRRSWHPRGFGDFWQHCLVAEGSVDVAVDPQVSLWDIAAVQVIVEEAGGRLTDLGGTARPDGGSAVTTNGLLHDEVLSVLVTPDRR
jgi:histidinol-phosphatase